MKSSLVSVYLQLKYIFEPQQWTKTVKTFTQPKPHHITGAFKCQTTCYAFQKTSTSNSAFICFIAHLFWKGSKHILFFCILVSEYAVGVEGGVCVIALSWKHMLSLLVINVQLAGLDVEPRAKWLSWEWTIKSRAGTRCSTTGLLKNEWAVNSHCFSVDILMSVCVSSTLSL